MNEYVRIRSGAASATMANREFADFVELAWADERPGGGFHLVVKDAEKPEPGEGQELAYAYEVQADGTARKSYLLVPAGTSFRPRRYSKLRLYAALAGAGLWDPLMAWLAGRTVGGLNARTAFDLAQELSSAHPLFAGMLEEAKAALGVTDAQAAEILAASEAEG